MSVAITRGPVREALWCTMPIGETNILASVLGRDVAVTRIGGRTLVVPQATEDPTAEAVFGEVARQFTSGRAFLVRSGGGARGLAEWGEAPLGEEITADTEDELRAALRDFDVPALIVDVVEGRIDPLRLPGARLVPAAPLASAFVEAAMTPPEGPGRASEAMRLHDRRPWWWRSANAAVAAGYTWGAIACARRGGWRIPAAVVLSLLAAGAVADAVLPSRRAHHVFDW